MGVLKLHHPPPVPCPSHLFPFPPAPDLKTRMESREVAEKEPSGGGWETPKRWECRIPAALRCPPPPRKKRHATPLVGTRRAPPRNSYFHPPDLEALFAMATRREACA
ncbi:hypothetical protein ZIOFF_011473 [Zingiber officinale]|uniref:Uncharacterized protein n=1 Tax=Zingiber officinale TaxID=94328 RepID=A0A8J5LKT1_ZINOF|nr:hypothetical protein ZIOFF_011473 [Zingiber officinale]